MLLLTNIPHFAKLNTRPCDWGKNFGLEKNYVNKKNIKCKRAMSWFLHASISIQNISIYHN
jgi:hypothetical protein